MDFERLLQLRRSIRFFNGCPVEAEKMRRLVYFASLAPSSANSQTVRFVIVNSPEKAEAVFHCTRYAALVAPARSPQWGKNAPQNFIAVLTRRERSEVADAAAAVMVMALGAVTLDLGTCWIGAFDREKVEGILTLPPEYTVNWLLAAGYPAESPQIVPVAGGNNCYYLNENDVLQVPKYSAEELIIAEL